MLLLVNISSWTNKSGRSWGNLLSIFNLLLWCILLSTKLYSQTRDVAQVFSLEWSFGEDNHEFSWVLSWYLAVVEYHIHYLFEIWHLHCYCRISCPLFIWNMTSLLLLLELKNIFHNYLNKSILSPITDFLIPMSKEISSTSATLCLYQVYCSKLLKRSGVLLYGPPGTGKVGVLSFILCLNWVFIPIFQKLVVSDNKIIHAN